MKKKFGSGLLLFALCLTFHSHAATIFSHPGVLSCQSELDSLKKSVATQNGDPRIAGYNKLAAESKGDLSYKPTPYADVHVIASGGNEEEAAFRNDAHALYIHAIKWVVTGNTAHRDKAIEIADAWGKTFNSLISETDHPYQSTLEASWALPIWIAGAEILKYYNNGASGWSSTYFESFVQKVLPYVNGNIYQTANWLISKDLALMSAGVFLNNKSLYDSGYNHVTGQIDQITVNGEIPELTRDFVHSQYVLIGMTQCAEIAYQQGDTTLFTRTGKRLRTGAEAYLTSVKGTYYTDSNWARHSAPYEILLNRYTKLGYSVPNVQNYVLNENRVEDGSEDHFAGWLTATHAITVKGTTSSEVAGNLVYNKTVTASSEPQTDNPAKSAIDNSIYTRWSAQVYPQWIEIDLGSVQKVGKTELIFYADRAYKYKVESKKLATDTYETLVDRTANTTPGSSTAPVSDTFTQKDARYLRLTVTGAADYTGDWASVIEFRAFEGTTTGLEDNLTEKASFIFCNTATRGVFDLLSRTNISTINVYDFTGKKAFSKDGINSTHLTLDLSAYGSGVYLYQATDQEGFVHKGKFKL